VPMGTQSVSSGTNGNSVVSLYRLLDPEVLANPYPLFRRLRDEDPVHWDPFLHAWVVTRYADVLEVLHTFSADRTPTPEQLASMGLEHLGPIAQVMVKQMLFMDASAHARLRGLASVAFTPARVNTLKSHIQEIVNNLLDAVQDQGQMDVIADLAEPLPAIVTAEMLGVPVGDRHQLKQWSANFAEMLGNFQHNPERAQLMLRTVDEMTSYFRDAVREIRQHPREGLIHSLLTAEIEGDRLAEEEVVANTIVTMVGGQETTTNLIGNGVLTLLRNPDQMQKLRADLSLIPSAVEEMLRYESPSQHTARLAPSDRVLGGKHIAKRQAVIAVMAAANRDPERFPDPDRFDIERKDNRHLAFGYAAHFCFGAPLARAEGQIVFETLLQRMPNLRFEPQKLVWRTNLGLRGLTSLKVRFDDEGSGSGKGSSQEPRGEHSANQGAEKSVNILVAPTSQDSELHRALAEWNNTRAEYPSDKCVHQLVEERAQLTPESISAEQDARRVTYRELNERANQLAHYLRSKGVGADVPVGICLQRSPELLIALLGVLKAGGACLPLDPDYPKERLAYMLEDSQAPVLITESDLLPGLGAAKSEVVLLEPGLGVLEGESRENPASVTTPENLAYVIYTSGSTGKPRGVLLTHRGLVNHNVAAIKLYGIQSSDRVLQFASISFDIAIEEIWPSWMAGATLLIRASKTLMGASEFLSWTRAQRVTVLNLPTAYWHELVRELAESKQTMPENLRLVIVGGEKASSAAYKSWLKCGGDRMRWINTYGPTEASVIATSYELDPSRPIPDNLPIGRPIANTEIYILNESLQPVPVGEPGELHIGGPGLARGYLNRPELTAAKFIANPFKKDKGARLYKTGDSARFLPSGEIEFIGRTDFQVKIRGYRIELGEIEAALEKCSGVRECVVIAREDDGTKRLVGYVVASVERAPSTSELRDALAEQLPEYMVPADFVFLKALPHTPNGKVDRRALPAPVSTGSTESREVVAPRDAVESQLVKIWEQVLGKRPIGIRDNFFELGGHSLLAVRLMGRVEKAFGQQLPLTALVQAPTIEAFAELVRQDASSELWSSLIPLQAEGSRPPFFFVHGLGGTVLRFHELARHMVPDQPFHGIQAPGLNGKQPCLNRVDDMATYYLEQLRGVQPEGPYFLGGYSFGGLVALEMARRLVEGGQVVGLLALVDTYPGVPKSAGSLIGTFFSLSSEQKLAYLKKRITRYRKGIKRRVDMLSMPRPLINVREACAVAERSYSPQVYPGKIVLFRASEKALRGLDDPQGGWARYAAAGLEIHEIDADHGNILNEPQVRHLAAEIRTSLQQAQSAQSELQPVSVS
jgi:amino acid adenylation domain-containing protein